MRKFVGRKEELSILNNLLEKHSSSLVVVHGRRRIGKSRLIEEFGKTMKMYTFVGLPPRVNSTQQEQLNDFSQQMARQLKTTLKKYNDWGDLFLELSHHTCKDRVLILFDEISWIGSQDLDFLGKLKNAWDLYFSKNPKLILVLCGSVSAWICRNILSNIGFYGRISLKLHLKEMLLKECIDFWETWRDKICNFEKIKILSITGGIPKYLEEINPRLSAEENIRQLCFRPTGLLFNEFDQIFSGMLLRKSEVYEKIVSLLSEGMLSQAVLSKKLGVKRGGYLTEYLDELIMTGFVTNHHSWNLKTGKSSKIVYYRLSDNYLRFYLKYIFPNLNQIISDGFANKSLFVLPGWSAIMPLQIENLVLTNRFEIIKILGISPDEVICDGPFFQRQTSRFQGCQIDYMIQTRFNSLYICEIKFSSNIIRSDVIDEIQKKIHKLHIPRNFSIRPVLIHANEVHDKVLESNYFYKIIDIAQLLASAGDNFRKICCEI